MALVPPTNLLEDQTVSSSFDQLLYVDDDSGLEETTLRVIASESTKSALQLCGEKVRIQSAETDLAAAFDVQTNGGTSIFTVDADTAATTTIGTVTVGVNDTGHDVKFFGATSGQYMLWDESTDELVLAGDSKLSFHDPAGGENIIATSDGHLEINAGTTLDITAPTVDLNSATEFNIDTVIYDLNASTTCTIDNTNTSNGVAINTATSGGPISIGNATSETTVNDNLTVTGTITANSTVALNDDVTLPHGKKIIFDSADTYIYANTDDPEDLYMKADADILLIPDGNVGVNVTDPDEKLEVGGFIHTANPIYTSKATGITVGTSTAVTLTTPAGAGFWYMHLTNSYGGNQLYAVGTWARHGSAGTGVVYAMDWDNDMSSHVTPTISNGNIVLTNVHGSRSITDGTIYYINVLGS